MRQRVRERVCRVTQCVTDSSRSNYRVANGEAVESASLSRDVTSLRRRRIEKNRRRIEFLYLLFHQSEDRKPIVLDNSIRIETS